MAKKVNKKSAAPAKAAAGGSERLAQRNRTRKAIVDATIRLLGRGSTPAVTEIIEEAQVSRRTIYMYFPTIEQLLLDATVGALTAQTIEPVLGANASDDPATRVEQLCREINRLSAKTLHLGRALIKLTVDADPLPEGSPRRGYRRIEWIERALEPARSKLSRKEFDRLVSALSIVIGWEALVVLKDVRGLGEKDTEDVLTFAARAILDAALRRRSPKG